MVNVGKGAKTTRQHVSGINSVQQTRRDAPDTRYAYAPTANLLSSSFPHYSLAASTVACISLLKLILNRRSCDSWIKLFQHSIVIGWSPSASLKIKQHNRYPLSPRPISTAHAHISVQAKTSVYKEYLRISVIRSKFRPTSSQERKRC